MNSLAGAGARRSAHRRCLSMALAALLTAAVIVAASPVRALAESSGSQGATLAQRDVTPNEAYEAIMAMEDEYPTGTPWDNSNYYQSRVLGGGYGCAGFAYMLSDAAFGDNPGTRYYEAELGTVKVGDILRINNDTHSVIVLEVTSGGVFVAEGNMNNAVMWGRYLTYGEIQQGFSYGITRYSQPAPVLYDINVAPMEHGSVVVEPAGPVEAGTLVALTFKPDEGYRSKTFSVINNATGERVTLSGVRDYRTFYMPESDVTVEATYWIPTGPFYASCGHSEHGTVTFDPQGPLEAGDKVSVKITPDEGYEVDRVTVYDDETRNRVEHFGTDTDLYFYMPTADVDVEVTYKLADIKLNLVQPEHGRIISVPENPFPGDHVNVQVWPDEGYKAESISVTGVSEYTEGSYENRRGVSFTMPSNSVTVSASVVADHQHGVGFYRTDAPEHGTVEVVGGEFHQVGSTVILKAAPDAGYEVGTIAIIDCLTGERTELSGSDGAYTFTMPDADVAIIATFEPVDALFPDVPDDAWYHDAVEWVASNGVMTGQGDGTFAPDGTLQRCEMAQLLWNMAGGPAADAGAMAGFPDYAGGQWYSAAMAWAFAEGAITGYEDGRLGTSDPVTREQFVTIVWRLEGRPAGAGDLSAFPDEGGVSDFSREALAWAVFEGVVTGDGGRLSPAKALSRAEAATMLMRWRG